MHRYVDNTFSEKPLPYDHRIGPHHLEKELFIRDVSVLLQICGDTAGKEGFTSITNLAHCRSGDIC